MTFGQVTSGHHPLYNDKGHNETMFGNISKLPESQLAGSSSFQTWEVKQSSLHQIVLSLSRAVRAPWWEAWVKQRPVVSQPHSLQSPGSRELAAPRSPHASGPALCPACHHPLHDLTTPHPGPAPGAADPGPSSSVQGLLCLETDPGRILSVFCLSTTCWGWACLSPRAAPRESYTFLFLTGLNRKVALTLGV